MLYYILNYIENNCKFPAKYWQSPIGLVLCVSALSKFCFQTINMSIQSLCYLKASRNRWFAQPGGDLGSYEMSWHSCSLGSSPSMHLSHAVHLSYSEDIVVQFQGALYRQSHFPTDLNGALQFENSRE